MSSFSFIIVNTMNVILYNILRGSAIGFIITIYLHDTINTSI
jgi:hypothetical protein